MNLSRTIVTLNSCAIGTEYPYLSMTGVGTQDQPLQLVLLARHSDMADETSISDALGQTIEVANALGYALSRLTIAKEVTAIRLAGAISAANSVAAKTGTYYSVIAAMLTGNRLISVGIGRITLRVQRAVRVDELLKPTTHDAIGVYDGGLLRAALGIGFSETEVSTCDTNLEALDSVMLIIGTPHLRNLSSKPFASGYPSPSGALEHPCSHPYSGILATVIVGCESGDEPNRGLHEENPPEAPA